MGLGPVGFDLDMTLIDSRPAIMAAFEAMSRDMSASIDLDAVDSRLGVKLEDELADPKWWATKYESAKSTARHTAAKRAVEDAYARLEAFEASAPA